MSFFQRTVTVNHIYIGSDLSSFPVLVAGTLSYLATVANGGKVTSASGFDIYFTSDSAATTIIPFERVAWNATTGACEFWVSVPTVSHSTDTVFYLNYGNSAITTDQQNKNGTWDPNFKGVWHFGNGVILDLTDSTVNVNNGTNIGGATASASPFSGGGGQGAVSLTGPAHIQIGTPASLNLTGPITVEFCCSVNTQDQCFVGKGSPSANGWEARTGSSLDAFGRQQFWGWAGGTNNFVLTGALSHPGSNDAYFAVTYDGSSQATIGYVFSGGQTASSPSAATWGSGAIGNNPSVNLNIGAFSDGSGSYQGILDEVRISSVVRTPDWASATGVQLGINGTSTSPAFLVIGPESLVNPLTISCNNPPSGRQGVPYSHVFPASGGIIPYTFAITSGALPPGINLDPSTGIASGTPTTPGNYSFTVTVTDSE